jgi:hypothetical protein
MPLGTFGLELRITGGANRDRTGDLLLAKQALSQLSYGPGSPSDNDDSETGKKRGPSLIG